MFLLSNKRKNRFKCIICGRKLLKADLIRSRGELVPLYNYIDDDGNVKPLCVTCYHRISSIDLMKLAREELKISSARKLNTYD